MTHDALYATTLTRELHDQLTKWHSTYHISITTQFLSNRMANFDSLIHNHQQLAFTEKSRNVMELLVVEEVEKQLQSLPPKVSKFIKPSEVIAYALNRLPALYATSKHGWQKQFQRGKTELQPKIATAVRQAIIAVQQDPLRANEPLTFQQENVVLAALQKLRSLLQREDLSWADVADVVEQTLMDTLKGRITWNAKRNTRDKSFDGKNRQP